MFDCCYRGLKGRESSDNVVQKRTFLMKNTGTKPSIGPLSVATVDHPTHEDSEEKRQRNFVIRAMRPEELEAAYNIRLQTNYVFSKNTIQTSWKLQPDSFLVAVSDDDSVLGSVSWCQFADELVILDQVTVERDHHGMGIGPELMAALVDLLASKNLMVRIAENVEEAFVLEMPLFPYRHSTLLLSTWPAPLQLQRLQADVAGVTVAPFESQYMDKLLRYDLDVFHCHRAPLVKRLVEGEYSVCILAFNEDVELLGYGVVQEMSNDTGDVSVLLADDDAIAATLLRALAQNPATPRLLTLASPAPSDRRSDCFATRIGFSVRQAHVCRFTRRKQVIDFSRVFSLGAL
ncbi:uncharacterized protein [Dermacentor albipictus]|uniref:uncharacterized protein isoform X1 n=1 Tax=Dermacentor albipictus TaxID=60249 RepID=UPI0031FCF2F9